MATKPRWLIEDKEFWMDSYITILTSVLAEVPTLDDNDKYVSIEVYEDRVLDRIKISAKATDLALQEMQYRFWENDKGSMGDKVKFVGGRGKRKGRQPNARKGGT